MKNHCEIRKYDGSIAFFCRADDPDIQKQCAFYKPMAPNDSWCRWLYDNKNRITDICHNLDAQVVVNK